MELEVCIPSQLCPAPATAGLSFRVDSRASVMCIKASPREKKHSVPLQMNRVMNSCLYLWLVFDDLCIPYVSL